MRLSLIRRTGKSKTVTNHEIIDAQTSDERLVTAADDAHTGCHLEPFQGGRAVCVT